MLAKSDGLLLEQHIQDLLDIVPDFKLAFPILQTYFDNVDFWKCLDQAIMFHDLGKATQGFQLLMKKGHPYRFRHEIISAILAQNYTHDELIISAILAHHKNFEKLKELLNEYENNKKYNQDRWIEKEFEELNLAWIEDFLSKHEFEKKNLSVNSIELAIKKWTSRRAKKQSQNLKNFKIFSYQHLFLFVTIMLQQESKRFPLSNKIILYFYITKSVSFIIINRSLGKWKAMLF